jgi:hypothetical protein
MYDTVLTNGYTVTPLGLSARVSDVLRDTFPATLFAVETDRAASSETVEINYVDGPTVTTVERTIDALRTAGDAISVNRRASVEVVERICSLLRRHYNCRTGKIPDPAQRYCTNKASVLEVAHTIWAGLDLANGFDPNAVVIRRPIVTATDLLREILTTVDNNAAEARLRLLSSRHPEARSASGILRRALKYEPGATHVRYSGGGGFSGIPHILSVIALQGDGTPGVLVGTWNVEKYGKIARAFEGALQRVKDELAPDAKYIRIDNEQGQMVRFHPRIIGCAGPPQPTKVPNASELLSTI